MTLPRSSLEADFAGHHRDAVEAEQPLHRCSRCREWKAENEFHHSQKGEYTYCRDCRNAYDRRYYTERGAAARNARRRDWQAAAREWMNSLKSGVPCADCGEMFPVFVMHWDHLPGFEKVDEIGTMVGNRSRDLILKEIEKCELVCANCHVIRTVKRAMGAHRN